VSKFDKVVSGDFSSGGLLEELGKVDNELYGLIVKLHRIGCTRLADDAEAIQRSLDRIVAMAEKLDSKIVELHSKPI